MEYGKVAYWVLQVAEVCLWYCLLFPEMTDRRTKRGERGRLWAAVLVWGGLYGYNGMESIVSFYLAITSMLLAGVPFVIFCRNYLLVGSLWAMISTSSAYLVKLAALLGRAILLKKGIVEVNYNSSIWLDCGMEILLIAILLIGGRAIRKQGLRVSELCKKSWPFFLVIGFLECMLLRYIMFTGAYEVSTSMMVLNLCVIVSVISCLIAAVLWYVNRKSQEEQRIVQTQNKLLRDQYDAMQEEYQRFSRLTHERNRERQYLYYCLTEGQTEQALNYLNEKEKDAVQNKRVWTKNKFLDFLINVRKEKMDEKGIAFSLRTNFTVIPIKEEEFCILLGNLLDNAIEAAEKCEPGRRRIALEISGVNGMFLLHMENTSAQKPVVKNGKLRSSKEEEGHGFGMENMRRIVENYGGIFRWEYTEQEFRTEILLEG